MIDIQENILNLKKNSKCELQKLNSLENELQDELELYYNTKTFEWSACSNIADFNFISAKIKTKPLPGECKVCLFNCLSQLRSFFSVGSQAVFRLCSRRWWSRKWLEARRSLVLFKN